MRAAIRCGLLFVALSAAGSRPAAADSTNDQWEAAFANAQSLVQARTNDVRSLRKETDDLVEKLNELARSNVAKLTPEFKFKMAQKRLYYYTRLGAYNAAVVEIEQALMDRRMPPNAAPIARQKLLDVLARFRDELKATVVSLNHISRSLKDL